MRSARFRAASRVFAVLLLAWTTADLCGHGLCVHDREPIVPGGLEAASRGATVAAPGARTTGANDAGGPDDCFCCCHCVDVRMPFRVAFESAFVWPVVIAHRSLSDPAPAVLYHPPLA